MARKNNPVRGQYMLVGTDLVRAGIRIVGGLLAIAREDSGTYIPSIDPATERWITSRAVTSAASRSGTELNLAQLPASLVVPFMASDPRAKVRTTEDQIVHLCGGENAENRAYAKAQVAELTATYAAAGTATQAA